MAWTAPMTFVAGNVLTAAQMNTHVRDNMKAAMGADKASCRVYSVAAQTIPTTTLTALTFDTERWDSQAMHSTVSNTSRITIPTNWSGQYIIGAMVAWAVGNATTRQIALFLNATYYLSVTTQLGTGALNDGQSISTLYGVVAGDYLECVVYQATPGNLSTLSANALLSPEFYAVWNGSG